MGIESALAAAGERAGSAMRVNRVAPWRLCAALAPIALLAALRVLTFARQGQLTQAADGKGFAVDVAMYVTAARITSQGGNPFDHAALYRAERSWLHRERRAMTAHGAMVRVGYPPVFFWAMEPLARLPFAVLAYGWRIGMHLLAALGFMASLRRLGWRRRLAPVSLFLLMPPVILGCGNTSNLIFAGMGCSLALGRRHPYIAGFLLGLAWIKPPVALPLALLVILFHSLARRALVLGFSSATAALTIATLAALGPHSLQLWLAGLTSYSQNITIQEEMPSLSGLYVMWASPTLRLALTVFLLGTAAGVTVLCWRRYASGPVITFPCVAWLWFAWFLAIPYVHFADEVLLTIPLLIVAGRDGRHLTEPLPLAALYFVFLSPLLIGWTPMQLQLLGLMLVPAGAATFLATRSRRQTVADDFTAGVGGMLCASWE